MNATYLIFNGTDTFPATLPQWVPLGITMETFLHNVHIYTIKNTHIYEQNTTVISNRKQSNSNDYYQNSIMNIINHFSLFHLISSYVYSQLFNLWGFSCLFFALELHYHHVKEAKFFLLLVFVRWPWEFNALQGHSRYKFRKVLYQFDLYLQTLTTSANT